MSSSDSQHKSTPKQSNPSQPQALLTSMFTKLSSSFLGKQDTSIQDFWKTNEIQIGKYNPNARIAVQQNDVRYMEADLITLKPLPVNPNIVYELQKDAWK